MTIQDLLDVMDGIPGETVMYGKTPHRLYRVGKCKTLRRELGLMTAEEKAGEAFTTKFDGWVSEWTAGQIVTQS